MIYIASDHAGFELKRELINLFKQENIKHKDMGPKVAKQDDDYPDYALPLAEKVAESKKDLGILICRNGIGMSIAANKVKGIRAGLCTHVGQAVTARAHDDCNILVLAADFIDQEKNFSIIRTFLEGEFSKEERHKRRLEKIANYKG
jgi:RpiB/LacA/LacB family sugar-phosphate isomerase